MFVHVTFFDTFIGSNYSLRSKMVALIAHERQGSLALVTLQGNMADVEEAPEEQNFHQENDAEDQMDVDQEPELDK